MVADWTTLPLDQCMAAIIDYRGKSPEKMSFGIPLVTAKIIKGGRIDTPTEFIAAGDFDRWMSRGIPEPGDVVMTTEAPLGEIAQLDGRKVALAQRVITLRGKPGLLDNTFLKFLLQSKPVQEQLRSRATGTTVVGIRQSELRRVRLTLPPIAQQQTIAAVLGALDDKIDLNRRMNATLEAMARALFQSWFVDFDPVRAKVDGLQPAGMDAATAAPFPDRFARSELGLIPSGWSVAIIGSICEAVFSGGTPNTLTAAYWDGGVPWLSSGETSNPVIIETVRTITEEGVNRSSTRYARRGSTVVAGAGQGHTRGQASLLAIGTYINQSVVALCADEGVCSDLFIFFDLSRRYDELRQISDSHSSRGSLTTKLLAGLKTVLPSYDLIQRFDELAAPLTDRIAVNLRQSRILAEIRDTLLPKLLSGEIRVPEALRAAEAVL